MRFQQTHLGKINHKIISENFNGRLSGAAEKEHQEMLRKKENALKLHKQGLSLRKIAFKIGVSHVMVANYLKA